MARFRHLIFSIIIFGFTFASLLNYTAVQACSYGPGPTNEEVLRGATNVVHGRFVESDTAQQNYVFQADAYLGGEPGPEFLFISMNKPIDIQGLLDTNLGGGDCNLFRNPRFLYESSYITLGGPDERGVHGWSRSGLVYPDFIFPITMYDDAGNPVATYTRLEFEQYVLDLREGEINPPLPDSRYPSTAPLLVTTENGDEYILPVAGQELAVVDVGLLRHYIPEWVGISYTETNCISWNCVTWSEDGRTLIVQLRNEYSYAQQWIDFRFRADNFLVSPISLAVWRGSDLRIYAIHDALRYASDGAEIPREIGITSLDAVEVSNAENSVWSEDGRLLAYSDAQGLWLWDVFTQDSKPHLLIPADDAIPVATQFSGLNRYLSVQEGDKQYILDMLTRNRLPFGYISPDERLMVQCVDDSTSTEAGICILQLVQLAPYAQLPGWGIPVQEDIAVQWANDRHVVVYACEQIERICGVINSYAYFAVQDSFFMNDYNIYMGSRLEPALDFAVQGRNVAILIDEDTIEVNRQKLSFNLPSPIVEIRWLPMLFYGESPYPPRIRLFEPEENQTTADL